MIFFTIILFELNPLNHDIKIEITMGILVTAIFLHMLDIGETLPALEYLTLEDQLMTLLYVLLGIVMLENVAQRKWNLEDDLVQALKIDKKFRIIYLASAIITLSLVSQL